MRSLLLLGMFVCVSHTIASEPDSSPAKTVRLATCQAKNRVIDWHLQQHDSVLEAVDRNLEELEKIIHRAGAQKCDVLTFPEDTLGLLNWFGMNEQLAKQVLPEAVQRMLDRLGRAAAEHRMYLVVCSDHIEAGGATYNTAFFLGRDGKEIGRYHKVWFMPGADKVYARFYVKFSADYQYNHHFVWLLANQRNNKWSAFGKAGAKPNGTYYSTGMEPWFAWGKNPPPGEVNLYSYFLDMEPDKKMDKYWGNAFFPSGPDKGISASSNRVIPPLNRWQCWEFMIQANSAPDKPDGKQAMWVDGTLAGEFTGIRWRSDLDLKVNCLWLEHYGYDAGDPTKQFWKESQSVWFDDVVVATEYIGPIQK